MASFQSSSLPTLLSIGRVLMSASKSLKPNARRISNTKVTSSCSCGTIWSRVQKMWLSSWVKPRVRISPCSTPDFSNRYTVPSSKIFSGSSRYERMWLLKMRMWNGQFIGRG